MIKVISYGGGTNSKAMTIEMANLGEIPDLILFADTEGEKPNTYKDLKMFNGWLKNNGMPEITIVKHEISLETDCLNRNALPGLAYGFKSCSDRWKVRPQKQFIKKILGIPRHKSITASDVQWIIGIDAGEAHRAKEIEGNRYPLIEWDWGREECITAINKAGLPLPGKSACFFCPSTKKHEIKNLKEKYPELYKRAIQMEENAELTTIKGLGRYFSWKDFINDENEQVIEQTCICFDGD